MKRVWYAAGFAGIFILVLVAIAVVRVWMAAGLFTELKTRAPGICTKLDGVIGAEDLQIDRRRRQMFVSATDRRAPPGSPNPQDGIYLLDLDRKDDGFKKLAGTPADFHPHGLSLYVAPDGARTLMVVNHKDAVSSSVEIFAIAGNAGELSLDHRASVTGDLVYTLNDVVAIAPNRFYAVSELSGRSPLAQMAEIYLIRPGAKVIYYDGTGVSVAATGLTYTAGIAASPNYLRIYVSELTGRRLATFEGDPLTGKLRRKLDQRIPSALDNVDVDADGFVWVAGHPKVFRLLDHAKDAARKSPAQIWRVDIVKGDTAGARLIYGNSGEEISAASVGAAFDGHLYIGAVFDPGVLDCNLRSPRG